MLLNSRNPFWEELRATTLLPPDEVITKLDSEGIHRLLQRPVAQTMKSRCAGWWMKIH
ncbi:MAG: hypothetical protein HS132_12405 [Planctomycetia bacterium]|nr:hypothetical protein [Planctomycetia bacterium]